MGPENCGVNIDHLEKMKMREQSRSLHVGKFLMTMINNYFPLGI